MSRLKQPVRALLVGSALMAFSGAALADGYGGSVKDAPPPEGRKLDLSVTLGGTSDYIFRGISQTDENPAAQGSIDLTYGIFYAGIWATNVDFDDAPPADAEVDLYAGIKPTLGPGPFWGPITFDFGVIYYAYPGADDTGAELNYVELKAGYSMESPWIKGLTSGTTLYWSPDYGLETGEVFTVESAASYALPQVGIFSPSLSGAWGTVYGDSDEGFTAGGGNKDKYQYWNAGLSLAVEKFTFDFRYWDTDIDVVTPGAGACVAEGLCDERFVFTAKVTLP
ncbi:TorF family putative porin [Hyphomicrobium sp.]|uniref:TorF family putative porin n=1 Tax=Hyphomicrobium sp. TaxID=82 RepID=UPI0025C6A592|nr:TorF family putative porin [Hyphomicrobium sp.]MCC7253424.1 hypothetical protein [Hyphomicrobium sp.]